MIHSTEAGGSTRSAQRSSKRAATGGSQRRQGRRAAVLRQAATAATAEAAARRQLRPDQLLARWQQVWHGGADACSHSAAWFPLKSRDQVRACWTPHLQWTLGHPRGPRDPPLSRCQAVEPGPVIGSGRYLALSGRSLYAIGLVVSVSIDDPGSDLGQLDRLQRLDGRSHLVHHFSAVLLRFLPSSNLKRLPTVRSRPGSSQKWRAVERQQRRLTGPRSPCAAVHYVETGTDQPDLALEWLTMIRVRELRRGRA